tara:strand:+ start:3338 stop:5845 length:2508 start_codon:yes stop_codon:yes gene_type:complete
MNREVKTIQRERPHNIKDKDTINENNINIDINFADKEKEHLKEMIQQYVPMIVEPIEDDVEEETEDDMEMDRLINDLENTIKEFMTFKEGLIQRNIDIPDNLLEIPDIEIKEKQDIINLIIILKNRIEEFKNLLRVAQIKPQQENVSLPQKPINPLTQPAPLRARKDFMPQMTPSRIRPSFYGDDSVEDARKEVNDTRTFIINRDIYNSNNIDLINRAILRLTRNTKHIDTLLLDPTNSQRENRLLRDLHKQVQSILNRLENKKIDLTGQQRPPQDQPAPADQPVPADQPAPDPEQQGQPVEEPIGEDEVRPMEGRPADIPEEEPVPRIPQKRGRSDEQYILELQNWIMRYENRATANQIRNANKKLKEAQERLSGVFDEQIPEDELMDLLDSDVNKRLQELRDYNNKITSTGRSQTPVAIIRNRIDEMLNNIVQYRNSETPENIREYINTRNLLMDRASGEFPTALAFENLSGEMKDSVRQLRSNDIIKLVPIDMTEIRKNSPNARQMYHLFKNDKRIVSNNNTLNPTEKDLRSIFTEDGDYYNNSDLLLEEFTENIPQPEEQPPPEQEVNPRDVELLSYRNSLYYTPYNQDIVNQLDEQISATIGTEDLMILDRTNANLPATIAYLNLPIKRIPEQEIESAELRIQPRNLLNNENSNDAFELYVNGIRQNNEYDQQLLFNEYGDLYGIDDNMGKTPDTSFPFRPTARQDLSVPEESEPEPEPEPEETPPPPPPSYFDPDEYDESIGMITGRDPNIPIPPPPEPSPPSDENEPDSSRRPDYTSIYGSRANTGQIRSIQQGATSFWDAMKNVMGFGDEMESSQLTQMEMPQQREP